MSIELAGIRLDRIHKIVTLEQAALVSQRIPGLEGDVVQNLGRDSVRLQIQGIFYGATATANLEALRDVYKQRDPVDFLAEIVGQAYFGRVILERFEVEQLAQDPDQFSFTLTIAEYVVPPEPEATAIGVLDVDAGILDEAQSFIEFTTLPDLLALGSIPEITDPIKPLSNALKDIEKAMEPLEATSAGLKAIFGIE